jgi:mRNA-degrading endonuclease RelE of RelBE toxin-antitoxin system
MAMQYSLRWTKHAEKELDKLDASTRKRIYDYMNEVVANGNSPEDKGKPLKGRLKGF